MKKIASVFFDWTALSDSQYEKEGWGAFEIFESRFHYYNQNLLHIDENAKVFVQVYGMENDNEPFVYADTLIIFSKLSLDRIKQIFNESEDIFPSDIGEESTHFAAVQVGNRLNNTGFCTKI